MIDWWEITSSNLADCPSNIQHVAGIISTTLTNLKNTNYWDNQFLPAFVAKPELMADMTNFLDAFDSMKYGSSNKMEEGGYSCGKVLSEIIDFPITPEDCARD